mmetsp:Transcript_37903/g.80550  ORF Transcript_37903/g.80550 Transcript_37903/m.80550 type:complete len:422 (-) Transcript_37903:134-1399(-)
MKRSASVPVSVCALLGGFVIGHYMHPSLRFLAQRARSVHNAFASRPPQSMELLPLDSHEHPIQTRSAASLQRPRSAIVSGASLVSLSLGAFAFLTAKAVRQSDAQCGVSLLSQTRRRRPWRLAKALQWPHESFTQESTQVAPQHAAASQVDSAEEANRLVEATIDSIQKTSSALQDLRGHLTAGFIDVPREKLEEAIAAVLVLHGQWQDTSSIATSAVESFSAAALNLPDRAKTLERLQRTKRALSLIKDRASIVAEAVESGTRAVGPGLKAEVDMLKLENKRFQVMSHVDMAADSVAQSINIAQSTAEAAQCIAEDVVELPGKVISRIEDIASTVQNTPASASDASVAKSARPGQVQAFDAQGEFEESMKVVTGVARGFAEAVRPFRTVPRFSKPANPSVAVRDARGHRQPGPPAIFMSL